MTTGLQQKLSAIKQECLRAIELGERATPQPWSDDGTKALWHEYMQPNPFGYDGEHITLGKFDEPDLAFIAHSRTFSPAAAKGLLAMIEEAERCLAHHPMDINEDHHAAIRILQSLAESWGEGKG